ncbi:MAG: sensor histidine kinase, partial [Anaerococcus vaginalis]|nr:sensor histidine kinase [Anaerococcus vaginalis]
FAYYTSLDDEVFNSIDRDIFRDNSFKEILISIVFASILSLVFSLFLKVEEIDKVEKLKKVFKFPIEAVILLLIIFLIFGLRVLDINLLYSNLYLFY